MSTQKKPTKKPVTSKVKNVIQANYLQEQKIDKRIRQSIDLTIEQIKRLSPAEGRKQIQNASEWFKKKIVDMINGKNNKDDELEDMTRATNISDMKYDKVKSFFISPIGRLSYYIYDAKYKDILPYWDVTPLVLLYGEDDKHFYGMNFHYIAPPYRMKLLVALYELLNNVRIDSTTYIAASYALLSSAKKYKYFRPCVKTYLKNHIQSSIQIIKPKFWEKAIMLPTAHFKGASDSTVWKESASKW